MSTFGEGNAQARWVPHRPSATSRGRSRSTVPIELSDITGIIPAAALFVAPVAAQRFRLRRRAA
jgi:hypothetical protein